MKQHEIKPRERILATISRLFHHQGYNLTGINQIVEESGVCKSSVYQHFRSKEEMAVAYLQERHIQWFHKMKTFISSAPSLVEKVLLLFDFIEWMNEEEAYRGCCFINLSAEIPVDQHRLLPIIQAHKKDLRIFIHELLSGTEINPDQVYLLLESAILESKIYKDQWPVAAAKSIITTILNHDHGTKTPIATVHI